MTHRKIVLLLALLPVCLAGCSDSAKRTAAMRSPDTASLMAAAQEALGQMHFVMDKYDVEAGYLRTRPQRASQFFEPWRQRSEERRGG